MATKYAKEVKAGDKFAADCDVFTAVKDARVERGMALIEVRHTRHGNRMVDFPATKFVKVLG